MGTKIQLSGQMGIFNDQIQKQDHKERHDENVIGDVWTEGGVKRYGRKSWSHSWTGQLSKKNDQSGDWTRNTSRLM